MTLTSFFKTSFALSVFFISCKTGSKTMNTQTSPAGDNSQVSLDWNGTYYGILPCADCEGVETVLTLNKDLTYLLKTKYRGKPDVSVKESSGTFNWNKEGGKITLSNQVPGQYQVGEGRLIHLDAKGNRVTGNLADKYVLQKQSPDITEKYWRLYELNGQKVERSDKVKREPHMILRRDGNRVNGHGGCNTFNGTYEIMGNERIKFSKMVSTLMACPDMRVEGEFMEVLQTADSYILKGDTLILNRARMAPLARFEAVYFQ
jgi:copper homeostasis protein (lipoprotein)